MGLIRMGVTSLLCHRPSHPPLPRVLNSVILLSFKWALGIQLSQFPPSCRTQTQLKNAKEPASDKCEPQELGTIKHLNLNPQQPIEKSYRTAELPILRLPTVRNHHKAVQRAGRRLCFLSDERQNIKYVLGHFIFSPTSIPS